MSIINSVNPNNATNKRPKRFNGQTVQRSNGQTKRGSVRLNRTKPLKEIPATRYSPTGNPRSTLADETLHCRVRNGNGCNLLSMVTGKALSRRSGKR